MFSLKRGKRWLQQVIAGTLVTCFVVNTAFPALAQEVPGQTVEAPTAVEAEFVREYPEEIPYPLEEAAAAELAQSVAEVKLRLRILEVKAIDETNPEWPGSDEIFLGGVAVNRYGVNFQEHGVEKFLYKDLGNFNDGTTRDYRANPWVFHEFALADFKHPVAVLLSLVEADNGGKEAHLENLAKQNYEEMKQYVNLQAPPPAVAALAQPGVIDEVQGSGILEAALIAAVTIAIKEFLPDILKLLRELLTNIVKDDHFDPIVLPMQINSPTVRWPGGALISPPGEVHFVGHNGTYRIIFDWQLVLPSAVQSAATNQTDGWGASPWQATELRFPSHFWTPALVLGDNPNGRFRLVAKHSGQCLEVQDGSTANEAEVRQWGCNGEQTHQQWRLKAVGYHYQIIAVHSDKCLDVRGVGSENGTVMQQWSCVGPTQLNQLWTLRRVGDAYQVIAAHSGRCLDIGEVSIDPGAGAIQWDCIGAWQANQLWTITEVKAAPASYKLFMPMIRRR